MEIGENIHSVAGVVNEIKDKATKQRLEVLPYDLKLREPSPEVVKIVTEFAKKTGDYPSLSSVDLRVIALTYLLEKEHVGLDHIKTEPDRKVTWSATRRQLENPTEIAGFYVCKKKPGHSRVTSESQGSDVSCPTEGITSGVVNTHINDNTKTDLCSCDINNTQKTSNNQHKDLTSDSSVHIRSVTNTKLDDPVCQNKINIKETTDPEQQENSDCKSGDEASSTHAHSIVQVEVVDSTVLDDTETESRTQPDPHLTRIGEGDILPAGALGEGDSDDDAAEEEDDDDDDDDDDGWITPSNIKDVRLAMGDKNTEKAEVEVGCITTDFAVQNVLIQMGLNVVSMDGMLIRHAKSFVLRCYACFRITSRMTSEFCYHCGNKTLQKVSMTVDDDGSIRYYLSNKKPISTRGTKFSLPMPKGGKHANNPILFADQSKPQQRIGKKAQVKYNALDPDYVSNTSPFSTTDVSSRAALLGIRGEKRQGYKHRRNPNENKKHGRRK